MTVVVTFVDIVSTILTIAILIRVSLSWFPIGPNNPIYTIAYQITEPVLAPLRRVVPRVGMLDFTPLVAILLLYFLQTLVRAI